MLFTLLLSISPTIFAMPPDNFTDEAPEYLSSQFKKQYRKAIKQGCHFETLKSEITRLIPWCTQDRLLKYIAWQAAHVQQNHIDDYFFYLHTFCQGHVSNNDMAFIAKSIKQCGTTIAKHALLLQELIHNDISGYNKALVLKLLHKVSMRHKNLNGFAYHFLQLAPKRFQIAGPYGMRDGIFYDQRGSYWVEMMKHMSLVEKEKWPEFVHSNTNYLKTDMNALEYAKITEINAEIYKADTQ